MLKDHVTSFARVDHYVNVSAQSSTVEITLKLQKLRLQMRKEILLSMGLSLVFRVNGF